MTFLQINVLLVLLGSCRNAIAESNMHIVKDISSDCPVSSEFCLTLNEYAQQASSNTNVTMLTFHNGSHQLDTVLSINSTASITLKAWQGARVTIDCQNQGSFLFNKVSTLTIENISFISCGTTSETDIHHGISIYNSDSSMLTDVTILGSMSGALHITNVRNMHIQNILIEKNTLYVPVVGKSSILEVIDSTLHFIGNNTFSGNSILPLNNSSLSCETDLEIFFSTQVIFFATNTTLNASGSFNVVNNTSPSGIVHFSDSSFNIEGTSNFIANQMCMNGPLLLKNTNAHIYEDVVFRSNSARLYHFFTKVRSSSGITLIEGSTLTLNGHVEFSGNIADIIAIYLRDDSMAYITGSLTITNHYIGYAGIYLRSGTSMTLNSISEFRNNRFHNAVIRSEGATLTSNGNMTFINNTGNPPCVFRFRSRVQFSGTMLFMNNSGMLYLVDSSVSFKGNSSFINNNVRDFSIGGGIAMFRSRLTLSGNYLFKGNRVNDVDGGAIYGQISSITFQGNGAFIENSARYGGAIYLQNKPKIELKSGTTLHFEDNSAIKGGALYVFGSLENIKCTLESQFENSTQFEIPPCFVNFNGAVDNKTMVFINNTAIEGGSVLQLKIVEDFDLITEETKQSDSEMLDIFKQDKSNGNREPLISSDSLRLCFCQNNTPICEMTLYELESIRGELFTVSVAAVTLKLLQSSSGHSVRSYFQLLHPNANRSMTGNFQSLGHGCTDLNYRVFTTEHVEDVVISADESCEVSNAQVTVRVSFKDCPEGFSIDSSECVCDSRIKTFVDFCDIDSGEITKSYDSLNVWIKAYYHGVDRLYAGLIYYEYCPYEYCKVTSQTMLPSYSDSQCDHNRTGILCGECKDGFSLLLGSLKCEECSNSFLALLIPFAILGIILVCFLFLTQLTVASGTIHGLILYANIVNANQSVFIPQEVHNVLTIFIAWLNLDFGIETCFYDGMDQLAYSGWQFVFPLYLWILVAIIIALCHCSIKTSKFFGNSNPVAVLATIILLSYTKLLQNVIAIFTVAHLQYPPNSTDVNDTVWYYDGNVNYGHDAHIILIAVALVVLVFLFLPYTLVLISDQLLQKSDKISSCFRRLRLTPFIKTYQAPYKSVSRFWIGLCLLLRCILLVSFATAEDQSVTLLATSSLCFIVISIIGMTGGIYSKRWINVLEISFILNLGILSAVTYHLQLTSGNQTIAAYVSISIAFVTFVGIVAVQIYHRLKASPQFKKMIITVKDKMEQTKEKNEDNLEETRRSLPSGSVTSQDLVLLADDSCKLELREPLLDDTFCSTP